MLQDLLGFFPLGNVLDDADGIERLTVMTANQGSGHVCPDDALAFGDIALIELVAWDFAPEQLAAQLQRPLGVFRVSNIGKAQSGQFSFSVTEHLAEGAIGLQDPEIRAAQHDTNGPFLKDFPESFLALTQRFFGTLEVIRQQGQLPRALFDAAPSHP